ncbi:hypothetical protein [Hydrogenophaga sp. 5NK40-0174]|uniref:hypothetical protein n=1 Tax=Hydrogenophaga sp. 5NK40-0174 TaxID=3127649 RepID=UPI00310BF065
MTAATGSSTLAGALWLRPGAAAPQALRSSRQNLAARIAAGQVADRLPVLLSSVFSLCGNSHRLCSEMAISAARQGADPALGEASAAEALRRETATEHVRRIGLDWPRQLDLLGSQTGDQASALTSLKACPLLRTAQGQGIDWGQVQQWLQSHWLNVSPAAWLEQWRLHSLAWLKEWSASTTNWLTRLLRTVAAHDVPLNTSGTAALQPHRQERHMQTLAAAMAIKPDFTLHPQWHGQCAHSGSWSRLHDQAAPPGTALGLLGSRLAELACLCLESAAESGKTGRQWLSWGQMPTGAQQGVAWVEMARGLLIHQVSLDPARPDHVLACQVLAPTEWNFHTEGIAAQAIERLSPQASETAGQIALIMAALDPCVPYQVNSGEETQHA